MNPEEVIEDVGKATWRKINTTYSAPFWGGGAVLLIICGLLVWQMPQLITLVFVLPIFWIAGWYGVTFSQIKKLFMEQFASLHRLSYQEKPYTEVFRGALFKRGHSRTASHLCKGILEEYPVTFFNYQYNITQNHGEKRSTRTYSFTVCEIVFGGDVPELTIEDKSFFDDTYFAQNHQKVLSTETEFEKHFRVYVPEHLNIEALEILTPEVMSHLIDEADKYDFQFIDDRVYVLTPRTITKRAEMIHLFKLAKYVVQKIAPRLARLHDDVRALNEAEKKYNQ